MRVVILTGGSEITATAILEELNAFDFPVAIISLGIKSILRDVVKDSLYAEIPWPPDNNQASTRQLVDILSAWGASPSDPWPIFASEDGGLRWLMESRKELWAVVHFGQARRLGHYGGLDKAELFNHLVNQECTDLIAPTEIVESVEELGSAIRRLGGPCVIKPSLKPLSMKMPGMSAKAFLINRPEDIEPLRSHLHQAWPISQQWLVQLRLRTPPKGEAVFWASRHENGQLTGMVAVERWKYPRYGGTGCWVASAPHLEPIIRPLASKILDNIDFVGMCEIPFLLDSLDRWRMLELNPRPWLQVGLAYHAGLPLVAETIRSTLDKPLILYPSQTEKTWVNVERILLAAISGDYGPRLPASLEACKAIFHADSLAIYDTSLPNVKRRWLLRMAKKLCVTT